MPGLGSTVIQGFALEQPINQALITSATVTSSIINTSRYNFAMFQTTVTSYAGTGNYTFEFQGSNDGSNWIDLATDVTHAANGTWFDFTITALPRYVQVITTAAAGITAGNVKIDITLKGNS